MKEQRVHARAYGCDYVGTKTATIFAQNRRLFGDAGREIVVPAVVSADHSVQFDFTLPPGPFSISYEVDGESWCNSAGEGLTIIPGHDRSIVTSMGQNPKAKGGIIGYVRDWHHHKFFAGTIPNIGLSVSIVAADADGCPDNSAPENAATIDGGAYYVGYVHGKHTFLKLRSSAFDVLYIVLVDAPNMGAYDQFVVRNITLGDLRLLATHGPNVGSQCIREPSGLSSGFTI
ncbi:MAG: hypothetical protein DLM50_01760 [Candidatus Meridianibacter frigidus]|nr:MAG: hypothetical protein DLM50_01760 [Candidatus Eremiobacteraeota bacterium]